MKRFDFRCGSCDDVFESFVRSDRPVTCPACGEIEGHTKVFRTLPGVLIRPPGYSTLRPGDPGYSHFPKEPLERQNWQFNSRRPHIPGSVSQDEE